MSKAISEPTHVIDPDGVVTIILQNPDAPFAVWDDENKEPTGHKGNEASVTSQANGTSERVAKEGSNSDNADADEIYNSAKDKEIRYRVSAKHLMVASPVFKKSLTCGWKETDTLQSKGSVEIQVEKWDSEALLILLNVLHCRQREIPRKSPFAELVP
ncbi:hypothetical protein EYZ11_006444 [Aspergillus tanneri]|uniref:BTB domain-containing protein n=1 Tax=Aspergillus tanneri TaxID=1220188 RepID=A0A4V3UP84_9EURO|nr:hypothetical protein EYZ11_006444 [Aspergillus tanneri]